MTGPEQPHAGVPSGDLQTRVTRFLDAAEHALKDARLLDGSLLVHRQASVMALALAVDVADDRDAAAVAFPDMAITLICSSAAQQALLRSVVDELRDKFIREAFASAPAFDVRNDAADTGGQAEQSGLSKSADTNPRSTAPTQTPQVAFARRALSVVREMWTALSAWLSAWLDFLSHNRGRSTLVRKRVSEAAEAFNLSLPSVKARLSSGLSRRAAVGASERLWRPSRKLDVRRSVVATSKSGGMFKPAWRKRSVPTEYLIVARQLSDLDLEFARVRAMVEELKARGVLINLYPYDTDPRDLHDMLSSSRHRASVSLRMLQDRHPDARLVVASEGRELVSPFTLEPYAWTKEFDAWSRRALVTPIPNADWGRVERSVHIGLGFSISSSRENALNNLGALLGGAGPVAIKDELASPDVTPIWVASADVEHVLDVAPSVSEQLELRKEIAAYLGDQGMRWLGICAHFPSMSPALAMHFGQRLTALSLLEADHLEDSFNRLAGLPWMRHGQMPYWARRLVTDAMTDHDRATARSIVADLFSEKMLSRRTASEQSSLFMAAGGSDNLILPIRIDNAGAPGGLEVDSLTIEKLLRGWGDIDPLVNIDVSALLRTAAKPAAPSTKQSILQAREPAAAHVRLMKIVVARANGSATLWRPLINALDDLGHDVSILPVRIRELDDQLIEISNLLEDADAVIMAYDAVSMDQFQPELFSAAFSKHVKTIPVSIGIDRPGAIRFDGWAGGQGQPAWGQLQALLLRAQSATDARADEPPPSADTSKQDPSAGVRLYISYRASDTGHEARELVTRIRSRFGEGSVLLDIEDAEGGPEFGLRDERRLQQAQAVIALIGPRWLATPRFDQDRTGLGEPSEWVSRELSAAFSSGKVVVPVFVGGARLPEYSSNHVIQALQARQSIAFENQDDLLAHSEKLFNEIERLIAIPPMLDLPREVADVDVFLAYDYVDREKAGEVLTMLKSLGLNVFARDDADSSSTWSRGARPALERARVVLAMLTPTALQNDFTSEDRLLGSSRRVLLLANIAPETGRLPDLLRDQPFVDIHEMFGGSGGKARRLLVSTLAEKLDRADLLLKFSELYEAKPPLQVSLRKPGDRPYVFVSYEVSDTQLVKAIVKALIDAGISVWIDDPFAMRFSREEVARSFMPLAREGNWRVGVDEALSASACALVCWSRDSVRSRGVQLEASAARAQGKLVSCRIDNVYLSTIAQSIGSEEVIDLRPSDGELEIPSKLSAALQRVVREVERFMPDGKLTPNSADAEVFLPYLAGRGRQISQVMEAATTRENQRVQAIALMAPRNECPDAFLTRLAEYSLPQLTGGAAWEVLRVDWPTENGSQFARRYARAVADRRPSNRPQSRSAPLMVVTYIRALDWDRRHRFYMLEWLRYWRHSNRDNDAMVLPVLVVEIPFDGVLKDATPFTLSSDSSVSSIAKDFSRAGEEALTRPREYASLTLVDTLTPVTLSEAYEWISAAGVRWPGVSVRQLRAAIRNLYSAPHAQTGLPMEEFVKAITRMI